MWGPDSDGMFPNDGIDDLLERIDREENRELDEREEKKMYKKMDRKEGNLIDKKDLEYVTKPKNLPIYSRKEKRCPECDDKLKRHYQKSETVVQIVFECTACYEDDLDFSD